MKVRFYAAMVCCAIVLITTVGASGTRDRQLADLEAAKNDYILKSGAFTPERRLAALNWVKALEAQAGRLSDIEFFVGVAHIAALANNGHDAMSYGDDAWTPPQRLPFRMMWFPDAMLVSRAPPQYADLLGARVAAIDGRSPNDLFAALETIDGGTFQYRTWDCEWCIERPSVLRALGLSDSADRLRLTFVLRNGQSIKRDIAVVPASTIPSGVEAPRLWAPQPFAKEQAARWRAANPSDRVPLYLQEPDVPFRMADLPKLHALYVQFRSNADDNGYAITPFVRKAGDAIAAAHPRNIVVDQRFNTGGDNELTIDFMRAIPRNVPGRIYVLTGRYTFSAGIASTAALKKAGGDRVTIVGEPVGDNLRWWSEGHRVCLPNSHLCLHPTTGLWDLAKGCASEPLCYGDKYDENIGSLDPQIAAPLTARAWLSGDDPGMDAVERDLGTASPSSSSSSS